MKPSLAGPRQAALGLTGPRLGSPVDVVAHLGAMQSQAYAMALWAVGRRLDAATLLSVHEAFQRGELLRTHVLRPTWHFVAPVDLHWLQQATRARVHRLMATTNKPLGLSTQVLERAADVLVDELADGRPRTRAELAVALSAAGLSSTGVALANQVAFAEVEALVCSGPMRGTRPTYVLTAGRAPVTTPLGADEALARLARLYIRGHGPARETDLAWWSSLSIVESRRAIALAALRPLEHEGQTYWMLDGPAEYPPVPRAQLLANFDEYISYSRDPDDLAQHGGTIGDVLRSTGLLFVDGRISGSWTRTMRAHDVRIDVASQVPLPRPARDAIEHEAASFGRFVERAVELRVTSGPSTRIPPKTPHSAR